MTSSLCDDISIVNTSQSALSYRMCSSCCSFVHHSREAWLRPRINLCWVYCFWADWAWFIRIDCGTITYSSLEYSRILGSLWSDHGNGNGTGNVTRLFTASLWSTHAKKKRAMRVWGMRGWGWGLRAKRAIFLCPHPLLSQIVRFALPSSSLAILSAR